MTLCLKKHVILAAVALLLIVSPIFDSLASAHGGRGGGGSRGGGGRSSRGGGGFRSSRGGGSSGRSSGGFSGFRRSTGSSGFRRSTGSSGFRRSTGSSGLRRSTGGGFSGFRRSTSQSSGQFRGTTRGGSGRSVTNRGGSQRSIFSRGNQGRSGRSINSGSRWNFPSLNRGSSSLNRSVTRRSGSFSGHRRSNQFHSRWQSGGHRGIGHRQGLRHSWGVWLSYGHGGWGLGGWGLGYGGYGGYGGRYFDYGYSAPLTNYYNPYCNVQGFFPNDQFAFDYTQPITGQGSPNDAGVNGMTVADEAFRNGDFRTALAAADKAAQAMPQNADVHQFRSLVLLAMSRYRESAAAAHAALSGGRGWNWETLRSFYPTKEAYTAHLRALESYRTADKTNPVGRFLLGYHYMMLGHSEHAAGELMAVVEVEPSDKLAAELLAAISRKTGREYKPKPAAGQKPPTSDGLKIIPRQPPAPPLPAKKQPKSKTPAVGAKIAKFSTFGSWKSSQADGTVVMLKLLDNGKFRWSASRGGRTTIVEGAYTLQKGELKLAAAKGGKSLAGKLTVSNANEFQLKLKWQSPADPALTFKRQ